MADLNSSVHMNASHPKGILKNPSYIGHKSSPADDENKPSLPPKELTIHNTHINAGRRISVPESPAGFLRPTDGTPAGTGSTANLGPSDVTQRLKWDEANLYLTEQERTSTMKITEPKTPYAKHYDPAEDPSDDEMAPGDVDSMPSLSLGEPEEPVPEPSYALNPQRPAKAMKSRSTSKVHVNESGNRHDADQCDTLNMNDEELRAHREFEEKRKKHYEMKNVAQLLGHSEELVEEDDDENGNDQRRKATK